MAYQYEKQSLYRKAKQQKRKIYNDLQNRHILHYHVHVISRGDPYLEVIIPASRGSAAHMVYLCFRAVDIFIPHDACPVADIRILQISKMKLIKPAYLIQDAPSVDRCSSAGRKNLRGLCISLRASALAPCIGPAEGRIKISGSVKLIGTFHLDHL